MMSAGPPGAKGITKRTGFDGPGLRMRRSHGRQRKRDDAAQPEFHDFPLLPKSL